MRRCECLETFQNDQYWKQNISKYMRLSKAVLRGKFTALNAYTRKGENA